MSGSFENIPYDPIIGQKICIKITQGYGLENLGDEFPNLDQIMIWLCDQEEFFAKYQRAKHLYSDILTDRANDIVKNAYNLLENPNSTLTISQRLAYSRMVLATTKWMVNHYAHPLNPKTIQPSPTQAKRLQKIKNWVNPRGNNFVKDKQYNQINAYEKNMSKEPTHSPF
ncbi:MAG: hypothetical protein K1X44_07750 [Alphaproteobacteria bacterium]|nr:hypothetical protein [Alphaproteobacteria bacterium]